jgi:hypothetical protein
VRLPEGEARERFAAVPVMRLGTADGQGRPEPKPGRPLRLRHVGENRVVMMLAGHYSEDWETLWWVRANGRAAILTGQRLMAEPLTLRADRYWPYREAPPTGPGPAGTVGRRTGRSGATASSEPRAR